MHHQYLDTREAAAYLNLSVSFLTKLRMRSRSDQGPPYVKFGASIVRYRRADLDNWAASREEG